MKINYLKTFIKHCNDVFKLCKKNNLKRLFRHDVF